MTRTLRILTAVLCSMSTANAVHLNEQGEGQVLIYPLYSVSESGYQTLISIHNNSDVSKAVKVMFLESFNQRSVAQFNLYLGPRDSWSGAVFASDADGPANLLTRDQSCTVPDLIGQTSLAPALPTTAAGDRILPFSNVEYTAINDDQGPDGLERTRMGSVHVIEMGDLNNDQFNSANAASFQTLNGGNPDCEQLNAAWLPEGYWAANPLADIEPGSGGLSGSASVIQVLDSTQASYPATAISAFSQSVLHENPDSLLPNLSSADFDQNDNQRIDAFIQDPVSGDMILTEWGSAVDAVSAVFMADQLLNEYSVQSDIQAGTETILYYPTRRFHSDEAITIVPLAPFDALFMIEDNNPDAACMTLGVEAVDRETNLAENINPCNATFCVPPAQSFSVRTCGTLNVLRHTLAGNDETAILPTESPADLLGQRFEAGRNTLLLSADQRPVMQSENGWVLSGLPVISFNLQTIRNEVTFGAGVVGNYMGLVPHQRVTRIQTLQTQGEGQ